MAKGVRIDVEELKKETKRAQGVQIDIKKLKGAISGQGGKSAKALEVVGALGTHKFRLYRKLKREDPRLSLSDFNRICASLERETQDYLVSFLIGLDIAIAEKEGQGGTRD